MSKPIMLGLPVSRPERQPISADDLQDLHEIDLVLTSDCNLSSTCTPCYLTQGFLNSHQKMALATVQAIVKWAGHRLAHEGQERISFNLLGGEPTLHPQFIAIVQAIYLAGHDVTLVSNGGPALRNQLRRHLTAPGYEHLSLGESGFIKFIALSADGPTAEIHDDIRGTGSFAELERSVEEVKCYDIPFGVNWTVQYRTAIYDLDMVALVRKWGAVRLNVHGLSIQGTARDRNSMGDLPVSVERRLWVRLWREKVREVMQPGGARFVIDCEAAFDDGIYSTRRIDTHGLYIDTKLCNVRQPTGITIYPDGAAITCPLHGESPELSGYTWENDSLYLRNDPTDEIAIVASAGDCIGCPLHIEKDPDGDTRLCALTRPVSPITRDNWSWQDWQRYRATGQS